MATPQIDAKDMRARYTLFNLREYVETQYRYYFTVPQSGTQEEREKEERAHKLLRNNAIKAHSGNNADKQAMKQFILSCLLGSQAIHVEEYDKLVLDEITTNYVFNWDNDPPIYVQFLAIMYELIPIYKRGTFKYLIEKYNWNRLRPVAEFRGDPYSLGYMVTSKDIQEVFEKMDIRFTLDMKIEIIVQCIYEEFKGNGEIDELLYQDVEDLSIGTSGLPGKIVPEHLMGRGYPMAYDTAWIKYQGASMQLRFLTLSNFDNLRRVVDLAVSYEQKGAFSEAEGYKLGYGSDGSRRTAGKEPFTESDVAWYRQFTVRDSTNRELVEGRNKSVRNPDLLLQVEKMFVCGAATIPICGPQAIGKTTKFANIIEYVENMFNIRTIESEFEAHLRWKYPEKNIVTMQTSIISAEEAYEASLRMTGDIYALAEVRSDKMMENVIRTSSRGGRCVIFTYHPNTPSETILEAANTMLRLKIYTTLKDAMYAVLRAIRTCIYINADIDTGNRFYNIYEFRPVRYELRRGFESLQGEQRSAAFMESMFDYMNSQVDQEYFETVPIVQYDRHIQGYKLVNNISDDFYNELMLKTYTNTNKDELEKFFRPMEYIKNNNLAGKITYDEAIDYYKLNPVFLNKADFEENMTTLRRTAIREEAVC